MGENSEMLSSSDVGVYDPTRVRQELPKYLTGRDESSHQIISEKLLAVGSLLATHLIFFVTKI